MPKLLICLLWLISLNLHAATLSTRYSYDEAGNKTSQTDALGHVTQWTYSVLNQITSRTLPDGSRESFSYDSTGQLISHTDFNNQTTRYAYDALNRLILTQYPDGRSVKNTYNASQQLDTVTESQSLNGKIVNQTTKYSYDINDRLVKVTYPNNQSISYSYDAVGNLLTRSTVNGTTKYSYDLNDRLATVTDSQGGLTRFSYDAVGNKTERILANGIKTSWQYNSRNQLTGLSHRQADGTVIADYQYTLDAKGNRTAITETLVNEQGQSHQRQLAYSYDNVDRLTTETVTDTDNAFGGSYSRTYQYDSVGNRSQQIHTANNQTVTTTYSYDVNDQLQSETTGGVQTHYRYDKNGNLIEKYNAVGIIAQYRYNTQNQLTEVILPQVSYRYAYDSQGNRIQSQQLKNGQTDTKHYLVDTNFNYAEVIEEKDGQGQLLASHSFAPENTGDLLSITNASKESRYTLEDGLGSLRQITNTLGQVQGSQTTTAWGENLNNTTKTYTDYGYTGEKQNTETGLVYLRAREYMPSVGRFVQRDTWTGIPTKPVTLNQFVYADANGVNKRDPSGRFTLGQVSAGIEIVSGLYTAANTGYDIGSTLYGFYDGSEEITDLNLASTKQIATAVLLSSLTSVVVKGILRNKYRKLTKEHKLFRGVNQSSVYFPDAQRGFVFGSFMDLLAPSTYSHDSALEHNIGSTYGSVFSSWTTNMAVARHYATFTPDSNFRRTHGVIINAKIMAFRIFKSPNRKSIVINGRPVSEKEWLVVGPVQGIPSPIGH